MIRIAGVAEGLVCGHDLRHKRRHNFNLSLQLRDRPVNLDGEHRREVRHVQRLLAALLALTLLT